MSQDFNVDVVKDFVIYVFLHLPQINTIEYGECQNVGFGTVVSSPNVDGDLVKITFCKVGCAVKKFITWCDCQERFGRFHNPVKLQGVVSTPLPTFISNIFIPINGWRDHKQELRFFLKHRVVILSLEVYQTFSKQLPSPFQSMI